MSDLGIALICVGGYATFGLIAGLVVTSGLRQEFGDDFGSDWTDRLLPGFVAMLWPAFVFPLVCYLAGRAVLKIAARIEARR